MKIVEVTKDEIIEYLAGDGYPEEVENAIDSLLSDLSDDQTEATLVIKLKA